MGMLRRIKDWLLISFKGKRIAVVGARGVGKTHLLSYLSRGQLPSEPAQTLVPEKMPARNLEIAGRDVPLKSTHDVSGDVSSYREWRRLLKKADITLYLVRFDLLATDDADHKKRVRDDAQHIRDMVDASKPVVIVGTHCDLDPRFGQVTLESIGTYSDAFRSNPAVHEVALRIGKPERIRYAFGSLKTLDSSKRLAAEILKQVIE